MEGLIGSLNKDKWQEVTEADKTGVFIEYHIQRTHKQVDASTFAYMVESDDTDPKKVILHHCKEDPIKKVTMCEMRLASDGSTITGMDLDGDVVLLK